MRRAFNVLTADLSLLIRDVGQSVHKLRWTVKTRYFGKHAQVSRGWFDPNCRLERWSKRLARNAAAERLFKLNLS
jgi:hypothetical protein